jgi:hypothetical protein
MKSRTRFGDSEPNFFIYGAIAILVIVIAVFVLHKSSFGSGIISTIKNIIVKSPVPPPSKPVPPPSKPTPPPPTPPPPPSFDVITVNSFNVNKVIPLNRSLKDPNSPEFNVYFTINGVNDPTKFPVYQTPGSSGQLYTVAHGFTIYFTITFNNGPWLSITSVTQN